MTDLPKIPETVAAYLRDAAVRTAVEALLMVEADTLPPGLEWSDLDTYYRARGGAELTRHDMAHYLRQLWTCVWGDRIGAGWRPATLEELVDEGYAVTPTEIWSEKSFSAYHYRKQHVLYTGVELEPNTLRIFFSVEEWEDEVVLLTEDVPPFHWHDDTTWLGWQVLETKCAVRGALPDFDEVLGAAATALAAAETAAVASRIVG